MRKGICLNGRERFIIHSRFLISRELESSIGADSRRVYYMGKDFSLMDLESIESRNISTFQQFLIDKSRLRTILPHRWIRHLGRVRPRERRWCRGNFPCRSAFNDRWDCLF
uniref:Uncharacterized protein n=1 Tax=Schistocephalus solidus TaxID=70667 RepID=A0A0X3Q7Z7_SCHSO